MPFLKALLPESEPENILTKIFKPDIWMSNITAASQSEAMWENPGKLTCILTSIFLSNWSKKSHGILNFYNTYLGCPSFKNE